MVLNLETSDDNLETWMLSWKHRVVTWKQGVLTWKVIRIPSNHPVFLNSRSCFQFNTYVSKFMLLVSKLFLFPNSFFCFQLNFVSKLSFQVNYYPENMTFLKLYDSLYPIIKSKIS